jgi:hypothetical protein
MTVTQTVEIPSSHRLTIEVPPEVPAGRAVLVFTPVSDQRSADRGSTDAAPIMSEAQEIELINRNADRLNAEALDVLSYQDIDL